jgi:protein arginine N-methyltransferase 7
LVLFQPDSIVVPMSATIYVQLIESDQCKNWNRLQPWVDEEGRTILKLPPNFDCCPGSSVVHDIQLSAFTQFKTLSAPVPVLEFDWTKPDIPNFRDIPNTIVPEHSGKCHAVLFWWELSMDQDKELTLSCAPSWRGNPDWRDHWIQAVYYLPKEIQVTKNQQLTIHACHDEFSLWFYTPDCPQLKLPFCKCGVHLSMNFTRMGNLNDENRRQKYLDILSKKVNSTTKALVLGEGSLLPLLVKKLGANEVFTTDDSPWIGEISKCNDITIKVIENKELRDLNDISLICAEPSFRSAILPWYNLTYWYQRSPVNLKDGAQLVPHSATLWGMPLEFEHLWKIRAPLGEVEGFNMKPFDDMIAVSCSIPMQS